MPTVAGANCVACCCVLLSRYSSRPCVNSVVVLLLPLEAARTTAADCTYDSHYGLCSMAVVMLLVRVIPGTRDQLPVRNTTVRPTHYQVHIRKFIRTAQNTPKPKSDCALRCIPRYWGTAAGNVHHGSVRFSIDHPPCSVLEPPAAM